MKNTSTYFLMTLAIAGVFLVSAQPAFAYYDDPDGDISGGDAGGSYTYDPGGDMGTLDQGGDLYYTPETLDPGGDMNPYFDQGGDMYPQYDPGGDLNRTYDPAGDMYPTYDPAGDMYPTYDPAGDMYPTYDPAGNLNPVYDPAGNLYNPQYSQYNPPYTAPCNGCGQNYYAPQQQCCTNNSNPSYPNYGYPSYSTPVYTPSCNCYSYPQTGGGYVTGATFWGSVVIPPEGPGNPPPPDTPVPPSHPLSLVNSPTYSPLYTQNYGTGYGTNYGGSYGTNYAANQAPVYNAYQQPMQYQNAAYNAGQMIQVTQQQAPVYTPPIQIAAVSRSNGPSVSLTQVPYTGIDSDILLTVLLIALVLAAVAAIVYFLGFFKRGMFGKILFGIY